MQSVSSTIWTRVAMSVCCGDNHYTTGHEVWWHVTGQIIFKNSSIRSKSKRNKLCRHYHLFRGIRQLSEFAFNAQAWTYWWNLSWNLLTWQELIWYPARHYIVPTTFFLVNKLRWYKSCKLWYHRSSWWDISREISFIQCGFSHGVK